MGGSGPASKGLGAPALTPPKAISLDTIPVAPPVMVAPPSPPAAAAGQTYTVQAGDSLSQIARKLGHTNWGKLYAANRSVVGTNPNMIHPGQVLTIPAAWQSAAAARVAGAPSVQAAVEPAAKAPPMVAGTPPAQVPSAPIVAPPSLPVEALAEPQPAEAAQAPEAAPNAAVVGVAGEAIDRLTAEAGGGQEHVAILREALKSIPPGHASYNAYKAKVEAYESAVGPAPVMAQPTMPADAAAPASDPTAGLGPTAPPPPVEGAYGPSAPAGATIDAQMTQPAMLVVAPAPAAEEAGDASPEGEEGWQAFS